MVVKQPMENIFNIQLEEKLQFNKLYKKEALYKSALALYTKAIFYRNKAKTTSLDGKTLYDFAGNTPKEMLNLHKSLANKNFSFSPAKVAKITSGNKERTVYIWPWNERVVDLMLYQLLNQKLDKLFTPSVFAFRNHGFGVDQCQNKATRYIKANKSKDIYVVKRDVKNCFPSLPHDVLRKVISLIVEKDDYLEKLLLEKVSFSFQDNLGETFTANIGVPFGAPTACILANLILTPFDDIAKKYSNCCYTRYADDMLFLTTNKLDALKLAKEFDETFTKLKLESKSSAEITGMLPQNANEEILDEHFIILPGFKHLGVYFKPNGNTALALDKQRKICKLFKASFTKCKKRLAKVAKLETKAKILCKAAIRVLDNNSSIGIIDYYLKHTNDIKQLQLLDRWLAEEVLAIAIGNGHKKGNFAKLSFQELRNLGLPSLQHRRQLLLHHHIDGSFLRWKKAQQG